MPVSWSFNSLRFNLRDYVWQKNIIFYVKNTTYVEKISRKRKLHNAASWLPVVQ